MHHEVTLIPGDSPELMPLAKGLIQRLGVNIHWDEPSETATHDSLLASVARTKCGLVGFLRGERDAGKLPPSVVLRKDLALFAQLRPVITLKGLPSRFEGVDMLIVREVTEDVYAHLEHESIPEVYESLKVTTRGACERIARYAYAVAQMQGRQKISIVHKANIMKLSDGLFLRTARAVGEEYPDIETEDVIVDALCMRVVLDPTKFDILLCGNLFGDIVGDLSAGLVGGASNAPAINIGEDGTVLFTAGQGSPVSMTGTDQANPLTVLVPTIHLLRHLDEPAAAQRLREGIEAALSAGVMPVAVGGTATASAFCTAVQERL